MASGSLGQGLSVASGAAMAKKLNNDNHLVYALLGDGELNEGQNWEAAMFAAHHKLDNLIMAVDFNGQQIDGPTSKVMNLGNLRAKFESFDWLVMDMNGNDMDEIITVVEKAKLETGKGKPIVLLMKTEMGKGIDFMEGTHEWHGIAPNNEQLQKALDQLPETMGDY
jgi:transketolase